MTWLVVRVRGTIHAKHEISETLTFLHLTRANHATVVPESASYRGMLFRVQGYVTWGEADAETVRLLVEHRGMAPDGSAIRASPEAQETSRLAEAVARDGVVQAKGLRPLFRLKAPRGGWRSTKRPYARGGALGYRGPAINELVRRMV
jgi:large subunit ribosomal protein L30